MHLLVGWAVELSRDLVELELRLPLQLQLPPLAPMEEFVARGHRLWGSSYR